MLEAQKCQILHSEKKHEKRNCWSKIYTANIYIYIYIYMCTYMIISGFIWDVFWGGLGRFGGCFLRGFEDSVGTCLGSFGEVCKALLKRKTHKQNNKMTLQNLSLLVCRPRRTILGLINWMYVWQFVRRIRCWGPIHSIPASKNQEMGKAAPMRFHLCLCYVICFS